jgi:hypothetical protein
VLNIKFESVLSKFDNKINMFFFFSIHFKINSPCPSYHAHQNKSINNKCTQPWTTPPPNPSTAKSPRTDRFILLRASKRGCLHSTTYRFWLWAGSMLRSVSSQDSLRTRRTWCSTSPLKRSISGSSWNITHRCSRSSRKLRGWLPFRKRTLSKLRLPPGNWKLARRKSCLGISRTLKSWGNRGC